MSEKDNLFQTNQMYRVQIDYQALLLDGSVVIRSWVIECRGSEADTALGQALPLFRTNVKLASGALRQQLEEMLP
jgi:hypothetical protein